MKCLTKNCDEEITGFCGHCEKFCCRTCRKEHHQHHPNHRTSTLCVGKDKKLKVSCEKHDTVCEYMCCRNKLVCIYCVHREHFTHDFKSLEENVENLRETLEKELQRFQYLPDIRNKFNQSLMTSRKQFEEAIKNRKIDCLSQYLLLLENEEDRLRKQFDLIYTEHHNDFRISQSAAESFEKYLGFNDIQLALMRSNILETIIRDRCPNVFPCLTASFTDYNFRDAHPLGELSVSIGEIAVTELENVSTFNIHVPDFQSEDEAAVGLIEKLRDITREGKKTFYLRSFPPFCLYVEIKIPKKFKTL